MVILFYKNVRTRPAISPDVKRLRIIKQADYYIWETIPKVYGGFFGTKLKVYGLRRQTSATRLVVSNMMVRILTYASPPVQPGYNYHKDLLNSWTPENTNTNIPRFQMYGNIQGQYALLDKCELLEYPEY